LTYRRQSKCKTFIATVVVGGYERWLQLIMFTISYSVAKMGISAKMGTSGKMGTSAKTGTSAKIGTSAKMGISAKMGTYAKR